MLPHRSFYIPAYVVLQSGTTGGAGSSMYSSGFLPSVHQGIPFRSEGESVLYLSNPEGHSSDSRLANKCKDIDQAAAVLITDLKRRDMLKDTLVIWGSEFGRTPLAQGVDGNGNTTTGGRDHHKDAFTFWLAGGGIRGGISYGKTDEFGFGVTEQPVHVHDLNATVLHLLGLDHERLTFKYQGREFRLTDIGGHVMTDFLV